MKRSTRFNHKKRIKFLITLGLMIVLLPIVLFTLFKPGKTEAVWMNDSWTYRTSLTFTHNATVSSATKVKFDIDTATLITAGKMQSDCGDSRFTDVNGKVLPYYIDSVGGACNTSSTDYYVLIPTIINGTNIIYHYYGNPSVSNGTVSAQFSQSTTTPSGGAASSGSEEKGTGPVAYWSFDEGYGTTAHDLTSNSNNGTFGSSTAAPTWATEDMCVKGNCLSFDGSNDTVDMGDPANGSLDFTSSLSVAFWFRTSSTAGSYIFSKRADSTSTGFDLLYSNGDVRLRSQDVSCGDNGTTWSGTGDNKWHYFVGTIDGSARTLTTYGDGKLLGTVSFVCTNNFSNSTSFMLANRAAGSFWKGYLDELKLYNYPLTSSQVLANYDSYGTNEGTAAQLGGTNQKFLSDGLVGYWKMDEASWTVNCSTGSVLDSSGNAVNGSSCPSSTGPAGGAVGKFGNAGSFDGSNDYVDVGTGSNVNLTGNMTISAWIYANSAGAGVDRSIFSKSGGGNSNTQYEFRIDNNNALRMNISDGSSVVYVNGTPGQITTDIWHFVAATFDGTSIKIYLDGTYLGQVAFTGTQSTYANSARIGSRNLGQYFNGKIDEVRLYKRVLSAQELKTVYNWAPGPMHYWPMDEATWVNDCSTGTVMDYAPGPDNDAQPTCPSGTGPKGGVPGKYGRAAYFDGVNDTLDYGDGPSTINLPVTAISIEMWMKVKSNSIDMVITKSSNFNTSLVSSTHKINAIMGGANLTSTTALTFDQWYHITETYDGTTTKLYINGILESSGAGSGTMNATSWFVIGARDVADSYFNGWLDEFKIYNYARTPQQIVEDMNGGHPTGGSPVGSYTSYWSMDEANGTTANDYNSTNRNSLTLSAASWDTAGKTNATWKGVGTNWLSRADDDDFDLASSDDASISMWFKSTSASNPAAIQYLFTKGGPSSVAGYALYANTSGQVCFGIDDDTTWGPDDSACTTTDIYDATWHHLVAEKTGTTEIRLYVDGKSTASDTSIAATSTIANSSTLYVGDDDGDSTNSFAGYIDEVKFYRSALTSDQVTIDMNAGSSINFGSTGATEASITPDGAGNAPVGYWDFNEKTGTSVADKSGNGNTGTWSGTTGAQWTVGKVGAAGTFNGSNNYVSAGTGSSLNISGDLTIEAWFRISSSGSTNALLAKGSDGDWLYSIYKESDNKLYCKLYQAGLGSSYEITGTTTTVNDGQWHHVTCTVSGTTISIYKDGVLSSSSSSTTGSRDTTSAGSFNIGRISYSVDNSFWPGQIDEVKIYNYARTAAQIAYDYNRGAPVGWWQFDECQGSTSYDNSGNANNGTITIFGSGSQTSVGTCATSSTAWGNGTSGKFNSSLSLDGTDDYVDITDPGTNSALDMASSFTIATWVNWNDSTGEQVIVDKGMGGSSVNYNIIRNGDQSNSNGIQCGPAENTGTFTSFTPTLGQWYHIVCTFDSNTGNNLMYINGSLVSSRASVSAGTPNNSALRLGAFGAGGGNLKGKIDDTRIYNYALSAYQVNQLYNNGSTAFFGPSTGSP